MSSISTELANFLDVVEKVAAAVGESPAPLADSHGSLTSAGLLDLGRDTADEPDARLWVTHTVRVAATWSPSLAFVLAGRYAADRALGADSGASDPTFALLGADRSATVATALEPATVAVFDPETAELWSASWDSLGGAARRDRRTGLQGANMVTIPDAATAAQTVTAQSDVLADWDLLTGAVLAGIAQRAIRATQSYVMERHQFGVPIGSFAGLRALVADMEVKAAGVNALIDVALTRDAATETISAAAGQATVDICLAAVQAHGGYGYIDEYPLTSLVRDAISAQARAGGRRLHLARVAQRGLGPRPESQR